MLLAGALQDAVSCSNSQYSTLHVISVDVDWVRQQQLGLRNTGVAAGFVGLGVWWRWAAFR